MDVKKIIDDRCQGREGVPGRQTQTELLLRLYWCLLEPDGCEWDREQTHMSLSRHMIEEAYEAVEAMETNNKENLIEELGDVLSQVAIHSAIAQRNGEFTLDDVARGANEKLIRRHPHVFGDLQAASVEEVNAIWMKQKELEKKDVKEDVFDSVPVHLPALAQAQCLIERAAKLKMTKPTPETFTKIRNDLDMLESKDMSKDETTELIGNMLFSLVGLAKDYNVDAESSLRKSCNAFRNVSHGDAANENK